MSRTVPKIQAEVAIGTSTIAGYGSALTSAVLSVIAFLSGDRTENTVAGVVAGVLALGSFVTTQLGRYWQARELAKAEAAAIVADHRAGERS